MPVNLTLGQVSNDFMIVALLIYSLSVLAFAGDFAFGRPRRAQATAVVRQAKDRAAAMATVGSASASVGSVSVGSASAGGASVGGASVGGASVGGASVGGTSVGGTSVGGASRAGGAASGTGAGVPETASGRDSMPALALP